MTYTVAEEVNIFDSRCGVCHGYMSIDHKTPMAEGLCTECYWRGRNLLLQGSQGITEGFSQSLQGVPTHPVHEYTLSQIKKAAEESMSPHVRVSNVIDHGPMPT